MIDDVGIGPLFGTKVLAASWALCVGLVGYILSDHKKSHDRLAAEVARMKEDKADRTDFVEIKTMIREGIVTASERGAGLHKKIDAQSTQLGERLDKTNENVLKLAMQRANTPTASG